MEWIFMDSSPIRVHQHGMKAQSLTHEAVGKSAGGHTSKIHFAVDTCGNRIEFIITGGNVNDIMVSPNLLENMDLINTETVIANRGFDSNAFGQLIKAQL